MSLPALSFTPRRLDALFGATRSRSLRLLGAVALLIATLALATAIGQAWTQRSALTRLQQQAAATDRSAADRPAADAISAPVLRAEEIARVNLVVRRLNTPWSAIFDALEHESSPAVTVLAVEPDAERGVVRLQTEGRRLDDLLAHAERMQRNPRFGGTQLLRIDTVEARALRTPHLAFALEIAP